VRRENGRWSVKNPAYFLKERGQRWSRDVSEAENARKTQIGVKREQGDLLGKENRTEERTCKAGDSAVMSARRESDRLGKGVRYPKEHD
jgi:hypothetical protein